MLLAQNLAHKGIAGEAFNFSDEKPLSVLNIVNAVYKCMGVKPRYVIMNKADYEIKKQFLCSAKARRMLGWRPRYSTERALDETIGGKYD
jgi:CDP-glucose 4,6-dehydratase